MQEYGIKNKTGKALTEFPIDLRKSFPNWSFPTVPTPDTVPENVAIVTSGEPPTEPCESMTLGAPELIGGKWIRTWMIVPLSFQSRSKKCLEAVDAYMDEEAQARGYTNIVTAITYADEPEAKRFQEEGREFRRWRSAVYKHLFDLLDKVQAGDELEPTPAEVVAGLPALNLPNAEA